MRAGYPYGSLSLSLAESAFVTRRFIASVNRPWSSCNDNKGNEEKKKREEGMMRMRWSIMKWSRTTEAEVPIKAAKWLNISCHRRRCR